MTVGRISKILSAVGWVGPKSVRPRIDNGHMNGELAEVLGALSRDLAELLPLARDCPPRELVDAQRALETAFRTMHAVQAELDGAVDAVGVCNGHGYASVRGMLRDLHQRTPRELTARKPVASSWPPAAPWPGIRCHTARRTPRPRWRRGRSARRTWPSSPQ